jgi:hypothetical protein
LLLVTAVVAFTCLHPPRIENHLDYSVVVKATYSDGESLEGEIPPRSRLWASRKGLEITRLEVRAAGRILFALTSEDLRRLETDARPHKVVAWAIEPTGVRAVTLE